MFYDSSNAQGALVYDMDNDPQPLEQAKCRRW